MANMDPDEGLRFFEMKEHHLSEGVGNGTLLQGSFPRFNPEPWAFRQFLNVWECEAVPRLRHDWTRSFRAGKRLRIRMLNDSGKTVSSTDPTSFSGLSIIDERWGTQHYEPLSSCGIGADPLPERVTCAPLFFSSSVTIQIRIPNSDAVAEPQLIEPARVCIWADVEYESSAGLQWRWHGGIYCYKTLSFEGPQHWSEGTRKIVDQKLMPVFREWTQLGRFFETPGLTERAFYEISTPDYETEFPYSAKPKPFWRGQERRPNLSDLKSNIEL